MPKIRQYQPQQLSQGRITTQAQPGAFGAQAAGALARSGERLQQVAQSMAQRRERRARLENERIVSEQRQFWHERMIEMQREAPEGAPDFTENFINEFAQHTEGLLDERPTSRSRDHLDQNLFQLQQRLGAQAADFQAKAMADYEVQQVQETIQNDINAVRAQPDLMEEALADVDRLSGDLPVDSQLRQQFRDENRPNVGFASIMGRLDYTESPAEAQAIERELLETDQWKDLLTNPQYVQALNRARKLNEQLTNQMRSDFFNGFDEQLKQWQSGHQLTTDRFDEAEIREFAESPEQADQLIHRANSAKRIGTQSHFVRTATPQELALQAQSLSERQQAAIDRPGEFNEAVAEAQAFEQAFERRQKAIERDRAGYTMDSFELPNRLYREFHEDPTVENFDAYADATIQTQRRLGLPDHEIRLLPNDYAAEIATRFELTERTPEGAMQLHNRLVGMHEQFGDYWPHVQRQMQDQGALTGSMAVAAGLTGPMERVTGQKLLSALAIGDKALQEQIADPQASNALGERIMGEMEDLHATLRVQMGGDQAYLDMRDAAMHLALYEMSRGETNAKKAARHAVDELVNDRYDFAGTFRIPKQVPFTSREVRRGARMLQRGVADAFDLVPPQTFVEGLAEEDLQAQWGNVVRSEAMWITLPDESGIQLVGPDSDEILHRVGDRVEPITMTWDEAADLENLIGQVDPQRAEHRALFREVRDQARERETPLPRPELR